MSDLEKFPVESGMVCTFTTDELTAHCPFEFGGPDYYNLTIRYETNNHTVESKSLKKWLESYRDTEISAEDLAKEIHDVVDETIEPDTLYIRLEQARRGGIEETVEVGNRDLSK